MGLESVSGIGLVCRIIAGGVLIGSKPEATDTKPVVPSGSFDNNRKESRESRAGGAGERQKELRKRALKDQFFTTKPKKLPYFRGGEPARRAAKGREAERVREKSKYF
jgi:hypothetical protein